MIVNKENKIIGYTITRHEKGLINWAKNVWITAKKILSPIT
jgi:hypothetical protein